MNKWSGIGRLTKDVETRYSQGDNPTAIARFTVACDRKFKKDGEQTADFISCIAFGKTAEFVEKYFSKGNRIGIVGRLQTGSYEKDGVKHYTTDIVVEEVEFVESKGMKSEEPKADADGFMSIPDGLEELPF